MTYRIYSSLFLSIFFHALFILFLVFGVRNSVKELMSTTYIILVQEADNKFQTVSQNQERVFSESNYSAKNLPEKSIENPRKITRNDEQILQERIDAIKAKKKILERAQAGSVKLERQQNIKDDGISASYLAMISNLIRNHWNIPDTMPKNLEAVISIRILMNGQIVIEGFEKSSGNTLFDSSIIKAIKNSSPLPPPKQEIVVGLRFKP